MTEIVRFNAGYQFSAASGLTNRKPSRHNSYYPHLTENISLEVSAKIAATLSIGGRLCDSYKRRKRDHDECSLDSTPGFEADVIRPPLTPEEVMELSEEHAALYAALDRLPPVQARRVYARFILGRSVTAIAEAKGVNKSQITRVHSRRASHPNGR